MPSGRPVRTAQKRKFIEKLTECGVIGTAATASGIGRTTVYEMRARDETFDKACEAAIEEYFDTLEQATISRARDGWDEPVFHEGVMVGTKRKYSDTLAIFHLKAQRPERYRDRYEVRATGDLYDNLTDAIRQAMDRSKRADE